MNTMKGILALALCLVMSIPCYGSEEAIKRKKNKWIETSTAVVQIQSTSAV